MLRQLSTLVNALDSDSVFSFSSLLTLERIDLSRSLESVQFHYEDNFWNLEKFKGDICYRSFLLNLAHEHIRDEPRLISSLIERSLVCRPHCEQSWSYLIAQLVIRLASRAACSSPTEANESLHILKCANRSVSHGSVNDELFTAQLGFVHRYSRVRPSCLCFFHTCSRQQLAEQLAPCLFLIVACFSWFLDAKGAQISGDVRNMSRRRLCRRSC